MPEGPATYSIPTISDVAALAGVSIRTVSRVLNHSPKVNSVTRDTVQKAIDALGFTPSARAQAFATGRSQLIGVVQSDENAHVLGVYQRGIVETCTAEGFELVVHHAVVRDPDLPGHLRAFVRRSRVDGLIILPPASESQTLPMSLASLRVPTVALGARLADGYSAMLVYNERKAAGLVARHLAGLEHRRIALVTGPMWRFSAQERREGFVDTLAQLGIGIDAGDIIEGDYGLASGMAAARQLLNRSIRPTAIFACNDMMAAGVMKVAQELGVSVPGELSVCGFDDVDLAIVVTPTLTTVRRPLDQMAQRATRQLIDVIRSPERSGVTGHADFTLLVRESTGLAPG